ncbi:hypothetical protein Glove_213g203 [Diversispora epigaea]|uniref:BTB domain-containing protein n=1 Tax=Diversispora epigaea TaxID=1348612 RepID=A0A397IP55_9GLOM|nr:hypothetical protein Glove_213g203 [Diversispora epigaea]
MSFKFFDKLSQDFSELLNDKKESNVIIEVDKEENKKSFTLHSVVLRYRSIYFTKELENIATNENHVKTIIKPNISAQIFEIILKYIYGGIVNIENIETKIIYELMIVANELEFKELSEKLESYLVESKASWLRTHFSRIYRSIFDSNKYNEFKGLNQFYNDIISKHPNLIFESEDFTSLQEAALISILERDNLQLEEIKIWDYVIKWGIAQNPTLPTNLEEWSEENFKTLKVTLQQSLPLIRYFHISEKDVWEKLKPYRKILGTQLWDDLYQQRLFPNQPVKSLVLPARIISNPELPQRINELISTIISEEHVAEISTWIYRKSTIYSSANIPYIFQLILRGSKDGFQPKTFWDMCNGQADTIVIAKVSGTDEILGGHNPLAWDNSTKSTYIEAKDSFIFSLKNGNIKKSILSRVKNHRPDLKYYDSDYQKTCGPHFGNCEFFLQSDVSDFTKDKRCYGYGRGYGCLYVYEKRIRTTNEKFSILDYEDYSIQRKILTAAEFFHNHESVNCATKLLNGKNIMSGKEENKKSFTCLSKVSHVIVQPAS